MEFCGRQQVRAFPTLRLFYKGEKFGGDFKGDRTLEGLKHHMINGYQGNNIKISAKQRKLNQGLEKVVANMDDDELTDKRTDGEKIAAGLKDSLEQKFVKDNKKDSKPSASWNANEHTGCIISGQVWVNKVPGNLHIEGKSAFQNLDPKMTNLSHTVNSFSFGEALTKRHLQRLKEVPDGYGSVNPMDKSAFISNELHSAFHHSIKVVPTKFDTYKPGLMTAYTDLVKQFTNTLLWRKKEYNLIEYVQYTSQHQQMIYDTDEVPEAKFTYDLSPMVISVKYNSMRWYDYVTKLLAVLGGTFTVFMLADRSVEAAKKNK